MKIKAIILLVILLLFSVIFLVSSLWSIIGLLVVGFGVFHYLKKSKGKPSIKRPLMIIWSGILLSFIIVIANTDTDSVTKDTDVKTSNTENVKKVKEADAKAKEEAAEQERIAAAEAKAKDEAAEQERIAAEAKAKDEAEATSSNLLYDPFGADKNCSDFPSGGAEAQEFYIAAGGPESDPHDLDRDNDGNACDWN
ncbi:excalibur calcium-binding domain-containing protein [Peribacillus frigoritolerans]|uniref:excalibur calcium-binding domain-containing protein n=1 Tax=Peribacillus frigoritolerans TaxID=450367 RepID=UPI002E23BF98|nr:excalibur calcium-binding domain-containing protein [Peribacillus frigoritolerans]